MQDAPPLCVVFNAGSGKHDDDDLEAVLRSGGRPYQVWRVSRTLPLPQAIAAAARSARERAGIVVAAGGDGTIAAVAQAALDADLPFGALPRGTFNYFARLHGVPQDSAAALQELLAGSVVPTQVGLVNGRVFLVNASLGLYPKLLEDREHFKSEYGRTRLVAMAAGLITLMRERRRMHLSIELEGHAHSLDTSTLFVANNALQLERVGLDEAAAALPQAETPARPSGRLAAVSVKPVGRLAMVILALRGALGRLGDADQVNDFSFRRLEVAPIGRFGLRRVKVAADGETAWMRWPLVFEVSPRPLKLVTS